MNQQENSRKEGGLGSVVTTILLICMVAGILGGYQRLRGIYTEKAEKVEAQRVKRIEKANEQQERRERAYWRMQERFNYCDVNNNGMLEPDEEEEYNKLSSNPYAIKYIFDRG